METKANTTLIGAFTLLVLAALIGFVMWFSRGGQSQNRAEYLVYFDGAVGGLLTGGSVLFNGIRIGEVTRLSLNPVDPKQVIATISVDRSAPIRSDTRVTLDYQGLTGITAIAMRGGSNTAPALMAKGGQLPALHAEKSVVQDLMASAREIMGRTESIMEKVDRFVDENDKTISQAAKNVENFTNALAKNSGNIDHFLAEMGGASQHISLLADRLSVLAEKLDRLVAGVDTKKVADIVGHVETVTSNVARESDNLGALVADARKTMRSFDEALKPVAEIARAIETSKVTAIVGNIDKFSAKLGDNAENIDKIVKDAQQVGERLNAMAERVDRLISDFSGGKDGSNTMFAEFSEAAKAVRLLAEKLDRRTAEMSQSFSGLSDRTSRDLQAITADGRRMLGELDRTLRSFEKNPQRLIFGGSGVPEYGNRR